jgi:hypothetical protein
MAGRVLPVVPLRWDMGVLGQSPVKFSQPDGTYIPSETIGETGNKEVKRSASLGLLSVLFCAALATGPLAAQDTSGSGSGNVTPPLSDQAKAVITKAHSLYYVPAEHGLKKLSCVIEPDWKKFASDELHIDDQIKDAPERADEIKAKVKDLSDTRFAASINEQGEIAIKAFRASGGDLNPDFTSIIAAMQKMIEGVVQSWKPWAWENPIPDQSASITYSEEGGNYKLVVVPACARPEIHSCAAASQIEITLNKDYWITQEWNNTPGLKTKVLPRFQKSDAGLLLTGANTEMNRGQVKTSLEIEYQDVQGYKLPSKAVDRVPLQGDSSQPLNVVVIEIAFTKYQLN